MSKNNYLEKIQVNISNLILITLFLIPFASGSIASFSNLLRYEQIKFLSITLILSFFISLFLISRYYHSIIKSDKVLVSILFLLTIITRILSMVIFNSQPTSDFKTAIDGASNFMIGPSMDSFSARFPYWGFYRITLGYIFRIFGGSLITVKVLNLFLSGLTTVGLYFLAKRVTGLRKFGLLSSILYIFNPQNLLYINLPTGEHIFTMFLPVAYLVYFSQIDMAKRNLPISFLLCFLTGILLGIMDMYKPFAIIILISLIITIFLCKFPISYNFNLKSKIHSIYIKLIFVIILIVGFHITKEISYSIIEYQSKYQPNKFGYGFTLRVGLDVENRGMWNMESGNYMISLFERSNENYRFVFALLIQEAVENLQNYRVNELVKFFKGKFLYTWESDQDSFYWVTVKQNEGGKLSHITSEVGKIITPMLDLYLFVSLVLSSIGTIFCLLKQRKSEILSIGLFILGSTLLLLMTEVQQRYRSVLHSSIPIFVIFGIYAINYYFTLVSRGNKNYVVPTR